MRIPAMASVIACVLVGTPIIAGGTSVECVSRSNVIAVVATGVDASDAVRRLSHRFPPGFVLKGVGSEVAASAEQFWGTLFFRWEERTFETRWMLRSKALQHTVELSLRPHNPIFRTNWGTFRGEGYFRPGPSTNSFDYEEADAFRDLPRLTIEIDSVDVPAVARALSDDSSHIRLLAASSLGRLGDRAASDALRLALTDCHFFVRKAAADSLKKLTGDDYQFEGPKP